MTVCSCQSQAPNNSSEQSYILHEMQKDQQLLRITGLTMLIILILNYAVFRLFTNTIIPIAATAITTYIAIGVISPVFGDVAEVFVDDAEAFQLLDEPPLLDAFPSSVFVSSLLANLGSVFVTT